MAKFSTLTPPFGAPDFDVSDFDPEQWWDNYRALGVALAPYSLFNGEMTTKIQTAAIAARAVTKAKLDALALAGWVPLNKQTGSASTAIAFTGLDGYGFNDYGVWFSGMYCSVASQKLRCQFGYGATPTYLTGPSYIFNGGGATTYLEISQQVLWNSAAYVFSGFMTVHELANLYPKNFTARTSISGNHDSSGGEVVYTSALITAIKFYTASGLITGDAVLLGRNDP